MKLAESIDAVERLVKLSVDHPGLAGPINRIVLDLLAGTDSGMQRVVRVLPDSGPRPSRGKPIDRGVFEPKQAAGEPTHYTVHEAGPLVGFDHQTVAKWCRDGRMRAEKVWRIDSRGHRVRSWRIEAREIARFNAAGLLSVDVGRNGN